ncbi:uncharacterized protein MEPE_03863 [Melanopsichium pennsylvanicum]|uniref:Secreted protein n=1 Tax=Melanopsichium pennsylvanicum TaxID=63383 RepID=A0AAJ5C637_9BASI|nr:uncharacterized protein MEPE_03863 [Melanopsichium pennsylvanicum]
MLNNVVQVLLLQFCLAQMPLAVIDAPSRIGFTIFCLNSVVVVSGRVPEIRIPVRKRDSPDFSEFRRLSLASTDIEENPASGDLSTDIG